jgi:hypothetical protein
LHEVASGSIDSETDAVEFIAHARLRHYSVKFLATLATHLTKDQLDKALKYSKSLTGTGTDASNKRIDRLLIPSYLAEWPSEGDRGDGAQFTTLRVFN